MEMTLDQFLAEVDRWKQPVSDLMAPLTPEERASHDQAARAWLEEKIGRKLREAPSPSPDVPIAPRKARS